MAFRKPGLSLSIGECMVELARGTDGRFSLAYGGDTFNTAVYLARCGVPIAYGTALGDDPYSTGILDLARTEGVGTEFISREPGRSAGLYLIETTTAGERTFHYWRDRSPARELFDGANSDNLIDAMRHAGLITFSGITLSLYGPLALDRFAAALEAARRAGATIAMDGNYRPRGWGGDVSRARATFERFWRLADIALPTFDDEVMLWGDASPDATRSRLAAFGPSEIAVKLGINGALCWPLHDGAAMQIPIPQTVPAIDTSAAGDSFNAAYLAARLKGADIAVAALAGHRLAGIVVQHRGAIAPREATAAVTS